MVRFGSALGQDLSHWPEDMHSKKEHQSIDSSIN
jgi:hypothetical protein